MILPYFLNKQDEPEAALRNENYLKWIEKKSIVKFVEQTSLGDEQDILISTVVLSGDHNFDYMDGKPVLWETMIFAEKFPNIHHYEKQYTSLKDAIIGHDQAIMIAEDAFLGLK